MGHIITGLLVVFIIILTIVLLINQKVRLWVKVLILVVAFAATFAYSATRPVENALMAFGTPEDAFKASCFIPLKDTVTVYGSETALVIGYAGSRTNEIKIVKKDESGWRLGSGLDTQRVGRYSVDGASVTVYKYRDESEYYVTVTFTTDETEPLEDSAGSQFVSLAAPDWPYPKYAAYIGTMTSGYSITVNGEAFRFSN